MKALLPNQRLIRCFIEDYYRDDITHAESAFVSSCWAHYSGLFDVQVDKEGNLISLTGKAFSPCKWSGFAGRILDQLTVASYLTHLPRRKNVLQLRAVAARLCHLMGLDPTVDVMRQVYSLELIMRHLPVEFSRKRRNVLVIGDGAGVMSALFKSIFPNSTLALVDIGRTLLFQAYHCQRAHPGCVHELAGEVTDPLNVDFVYCPTELLEKLESFKFDLVINIDSMQEMNNSTIDRYFTFLRSRLDPTNLFYCCNRESKTLFDGEVVDFEKYPWENGDRIIVDGPCPWHRYRFAAARGSRSPHVLGMRVPFVQYYAGRTVHRLAVLAVHPTVPSA